MMRQDKQIEDACTAMARAMAQLVDAVAGRTGTIAGSAGSGNHKAFEQAKVITADPTMTVQAVDDDCARLGRHIHVYLAGSRGCAALAKTYGSRIMAALGLNSAPYVVKCGTTTGDLAARLRQIGQDGYGAAVRTEDGVQVQPGFAAWIAHTISTSRQPRDPAIKLMPRVISVDLPPGLTRRRFDAALHRALKARALASVPGNEVPRRYVAYQLVETRISVATEFYAMSPHDSATGDLLLDAIEAILCAAHAKRA